MSDELAIQGVNQPQVKQSNPLPYALGGAAIGAVGGYAGASYATKPKYASHEDIIKDTKDNFEKAAKEAISDEAGQTKAINAYQAGIDAGNKWEADKKAYIDTNKDGAVIPDENYKKLESELKSKTEAYESKQAELVKAKVEELKKSNPVTTTEGTTKSATLAQTMEHKANQLYRAADDRSRLATLDGELRSMAKDIAEKFEYTGTPEEIKVAKEKVANEIIEYTHQLASQKDIRNAKPGTPKLVKEYLGLQQSKENAVKEIDSAFAKIQEMTGKDLKALYARDKNLAAYKLKGLSTGEKNRLEMLKKLQTKYAEAAKTSGSTTIKGWELLKAIIRNGEIPVGTLNDEKSVLEKFTEGLTKKEKKAFERMFNGDVDKKALENAIKDSENRLNAISQSWTKIVDSQEQISNLGRDMKSKMAEITSEHGKGTYIKDGVLYGKDGKPIKATKPKMPAAPKFELPANATEPKDFRIEYTSKYTSTPLSEEQIAQKAKEAITDDMLKTEIEARNAAQKALDDAKAKLPKGEAKTEEQLLKEFIEKNGEKSEAVKKAFGEDVKALLEKKIPNKKLALWIGGGAAALATLGYLIAPKHKDDIA